MATISLICGASGTGKGQPKTDIIPTPLGDVVFGDLKVGDKVFGHDGKPTTVTKIHDRGLIPTYKVVFSDGSTKIVDGDHIWTLERQRKYGTTIRNVTTKELEGKKLTNYYLPMTTVEYSEKDLPVDPYLLGLWLADGSIDHGVRITKKDPKIVEYLKTVASRVRQGENGVYQFDFNSENEHLNKDKLYFCGFNETVKSRQKAVPTIYLLSSIAQRVRLLEGLMDGDGSETHNDRTNAQCKLYSTTSITLAKTVHRLITSLGIVARDRHIIDKREGKIDYYQVSFNPDSKYNKRSISDVIRIEDQDIQCIEVDDSRSLYVCDTYNHLLTHNSTSLRNFGEDELALINVLKKPLPFKKHFNSTFASDDYKEIKEKLATTKKKVIVIDDAGYLITNHFMRGHSNAGAGNGVFALYNDIGDFFWAFIGWCANRLPEDKTVYFMMHEAYSDGENRIKPKTIGKLLDEKVDVAGMFTVVLRTVTQDGKYYFKTHTDGVDSAKTPLDMFKDDLIDNDLKAVDKVIRNFYEIDKKGDK